MERSSSAPAVAAGGALVLLAAGVLAIGAEPPIEPAIVLLVLSAAAGALGCVLSRSRWLALVVNGGATAGALVVLYVLWSLMTH